MPTNPHSIDFRTLRDALDDEPDHIGHHSRGEDALRAYAWDEDEDDHADPEGDDDFDDLDDFDEDEEIACDDAEADWPDLDDERQCSRCGGRMMLGPDRPCPAC